jgi:hypothetical protein
MNEYDYLEWLIEERFFSKRERITYPIQDLAREALKNGWDIEAASELEQLVKISHQRLWDEKLRALWILHWLKRDTQTDSSRSGGLLQTRVLLRADGKTYPDVYENYQFPVKEEF